MKNFYIKNTQIHVYFQKIKNLITSLLGQSTRPIEDIWHILYAHLNMNLVYQDCIINYSISSLKK